MCCLYLTFSTSPRALCCSHVLPQAHQCMRALSSRRRLSFLRFQAGWLPCNCGFPRGQEVVYYSDIRNVYIICISQISVEQHSVQLSPLQQKLEGCVLPGGPTSSGLPSQIGPTKLPAAELACPGPVPILSRGVLRQTLSCEKCIFAETLGNLLLLLSLLSLPCFSLYFPRDLLLNLSCFYLWQTKVLAH